MLVADESATPAVLAILEDVPASLVAEVFLEVPEIPSLPRPARTLDAVKGAALPHGRTYTWAAGESGLVTGVRRHLVRERGVPRSDIAFYGYWRHGRSSPG